ncbi:MAG: hypothetical protein AMJ54_11165 [Deltaproteobacteria bacterium SG8_13]|nr:MAG: hypothetical protein AMJ54_11165 [Deltaproteobacteria bacterium SG8_13]
MKKSSITAIICLLLFAGCDPWVPVEGEFKSAGHNFTVEFPQHWKRYNPEKGGVVFTVDGLALQFIRISRTPAEKALPHAKRNFGKGMLQEEAAELIIQDLRANPEMMNQRIVENTPDQLGGHNGFKIVYTYRTKGGLKKKGVIYGLLMQPWCYRLTYEAAERHYFAKELPAFARVKDSFRLLKAPY